MMILFVWRASTQAAVVLCACAAFVPASAGAIKDKPFAITKFTLQTTERTKEVPLGGTLFEIVNEPYTFTQAGGHPWALTGTGEVTNEEVETLDKTGQHSVVPTHDAKDIVVDLPPGLLGDPSAAPRCLLTQILSNSRPCPASTQVGVFRLHWNGGTEFLGPILNATPEVGQSAEFVLDTGGKFDTVLTAHLVRTINPHTGQGEYGFTVASNNIPIVALVGFEVTFWGVPADESHRPMRGRICTTQIPGHPLDCEGGNEPAGVPAVPFLTMPMDCTAGPEAATMRADSWEEPVRYEYGQIVEGKYTEAITTLPGATGCNLLRFNAGTGIGVKPDTELADEPVGLEVGLKIPLTEQPEANATPLLRDTVVTLPQGMSVSPGVVDGIQACNAFGPEGINITGPESEEVGLNGEPQLAPGHCPSASTVGEAEAITPFLPEPVKGHVYLARPGCGNAALGQRECTEKDALDGNLYRLYLEIGGKGVLEGEGIVFKVPFEVQANPATGQLTTNVRELVQAPYSEVKIHLNGGPRAPLDNPAVCGRAVTTADFTPWSAPGITPEGLAMAGTPDATSSSEFEVQGCASPPGLKPGFTAGTVTPNAAKFSSFTMNLSRADREQYVKGIQLHTPPGLLALLASVPLCPEAQANAPSVYGECTSSKIGTTRVASGAGSHPFEIEGNVYLTGPHDGAPFGLSIVTHAVAGPFDLGLVVVRARIDIDPENSTATITTDETGPYAVPQIIFGVPLRLQRITVDVDRPGFMFNPTNCAAQQITAKISGSQDAVASVSSPFAVGGCKSLAFAPKFTVSTSGHTSRVDGATLDAKLSYPKGALGADANIAYVKVDLPKQLPSRLTTLQKACPAATFNTDPAACPLASVVGIARTTTPLLPVQLSGPVYFVSHGGEAFPNLIVVLQGDGVRVDLVGDTFINKAGITSSTFKTVPDVPVNSFELFLPQGKFSALAANGNLCKATNTVTVKKRVKRRINGRIVHRTVTTHKTVPGLVMPTDFIAQNGAVMKQSTKIAVSGCAKPKQKAKKRGRAGK
jgi:hypothetical protein